MTLTKKVHELEEKLREQQTELSTLQNDHEQIVNEEKIKQQAHDIEILTLKKACQMQKADIETLTQENDDGNSYNKELIEKHMEEMLRLEEEFNEEKNTLKDKLHEVKYV